MRRKLSALFLLVGAALAGLAIGLEEAGAVVTSVTVNRDMDFSSTAPDGGAASTAVESATGTKTVTGGATDFGGSDNSAKYLVQGTKDTSYACTLPSSISATSGGNSATVDTFTTDVSLSGTFPQNGRQTIQVGGTLNFAAGQPAGAYSGSLTLTCGAFSDSDVVSVIKTNGTVERVSYGRIWLIFV